MNKRKFFFAALIILVLIFVVPIIINECYKLNRGYITMWGAADVLNYYGTLLGAIVSVTLLLITIAYYRKQVIYEITLKQQQKKWSNIEQIINKTLDDIDPLKIEKIIAEAAEAAQAALLFIRLNMYKTNANVSVDKLLLALNVQDEEKLDGLINEICSTMKKLCNIEKEYSSIFADYQMNSMFLKTMNKESNSQETTANYNILNFADFMDKSKDVNKRLNEVYEKEYKPIISHKREVFKHIHEEILKHTEKILYF